MHPLQRTRLGRIDEFTSFPALTLVQGQPYFLINTEAGYQLLSAICPHQGGTIQDVGSHFECPIHNWRFDGTTGQCLNAPSRSMTAHTVTVESGVLWADLPLNQGAAAAPVRRAADGLTLGLHAHACLELARGGFTLLMDPWLDGPAFLGAWTQAPPPVVTGAELRPHAVLLTHEHSDHFHEPTLRHLPRTTEMLVPDFPNQRMRRRLEALGFTGVRTVRFGEPLAIHRGWTITLFEPDSYWNDAIALIDADGFRLLNINDAGLNPRIARMVGPVDLLAVQFSAGASGYPWTWSHLTDADKATIGERMCAGKLKLIRQAAALYRAGRVVPFASHFALWHQDHLHYASMLRRNTMQDVHHAMAGSGVDVLDLMPGDSWDAGRGAIVRSDRQPAPFDRAKTLAALPTDDSLTAAELEAYLLRMNEVPEIGRCEPITVRMIGRSSGHMPTIDVSFEIRDGRLTLLPAPPEQANLTIAMPRTVLTAVIRQDLSWDEAFIGYWCEFHRHPDVYHAGFWRLFQAPYFKKPIAITRATNSTEISSASTIAEVLEAHGATADRLLRRYGLYCLGCQHAVSDSIALGARHHGIDEQRVSRLIRDLNSAIAAGAVTNDD